MRYCPLILLCLLLASCVAPDPLEAPEGDKAAELVARLKDHPTDVEASADLLRIQMERSDAEGARLTVEHTMFHCSGDFRAYLLAAQYHRWQLDLLTAEKELRKARELVPLRVEPRVALAALYRDAALDTDELIQREAAVQLADDATRAELLLDLIYTRATGGQAQRALDQARALANSAAPSLVRCRAWLLISELALDASDETSAVAALLEARKLEPRDRSVVRFAARLAAALANPAPLRAMFEDVLAKQEDPEARFGALFGLWTTDVCLALRAEKDAFSKEIEATWLRLLEIDEGQPDALSRRYLLISLHEHRKPEAERIKQRLEQLGFGAPATASSAAALVRLWRAEDCLRLGAAHPCLAELDQLMPREPRMPALKLLRATGLFVTRQDAACIEYINGLLAETQGKGDELIAMKRQIQLRQGKAIELVRELEGSEPTSQNDIWVLAVARFHTYRVK
ncbi:MAG: hypothetical protein IT462_12000 [Planctomycetes bacterium]|nr:hypothetical protein [Planctomycetota bacterium]